MVLVCIFLLRLLRLCLCVIIAIFMYFSSKLALRFSSKNFKILAFRVRSLIHFEFIVAEYKTRIQLHPCPIPLLKSPLSLAERLDTSVENH